MVEAERFLEAVDAVYRWANGEEMRMAITIGGKTDTAPASVKKALLDYQLQHPESEIEIYRLNSILTRIRVVDPDLDIISKS